MTIVESLKTYHNIEIELLLAHVLKTSKEFLFLHPEYRLSKNQTKKLSSLIKRREKGEPIAYILGCKDFYGLRFKINKHVLIPRPETEQMVELIMKHEAWNVKHGRRKSSKIHDSSLKILDVGTGSGCVAISLAKKLQVTRYKVQVVASDISDAALKVARQNAKELLPLTPSPLPRGRGIKGEGVKIKFFKSDLLKNIKFTPDILVANLPYGWKAWKNNTSAATAGLKFEPQQALFTKEQGLYLIRLLLEQIAERKSQPREIFLEFDPRQKIRLHQTIKKILPKAAVKFYKDFNNYWRICQITINHEPTSKKL